MIKQAVKPHPKFKVIELVDVSFTVEKTLPKLQALFTKDQLIFLMGSDTAESLMSWPKVNRLLKSSEIVIGVRQNQDKYKLAETISAWPIQPKRILVMDSYAPLISSSRVREALRSNKTETGVLASVERYSNKNWLYVSVA